MPRPGRIRELIAAFKDEKVTKPQLYRGLMHHTAWRVAGTKGDGGALSLGFLTRPEGGRILEIFSDGHAVRTFEDKGGDLDPQRVVLSGRALFEVLDEALVDRINIDPLSPHSFHFLKPQVPMLRAWARIAALEEALATPERFEDPVGHMAHFEHYHVVMVPAEDDDAHDFVLAPDSHGRSLAAIFTSEDVALEFVESIGVPEAVVMQQASRDLFESLGEMGLEGMVFNPMTSLPPRALSAGLIPKILERHHR